MLKRLDKQWAYDSKIPPNPAASAHLQKPQMTGRWKRQGQQVFWEDEQEIDEIYEDDDVFYQDAHEYDAETQESVGEWQDYEPDETYYHDEPDDLDSMFDAQEFDEVYNTYVDAKNRLNQFRQSKGFYPVVAVMDGGKGGQAPVMAQSPFKGKSKGVGKSKSPSKGSKGKTSTAGKGPSGKSRARSAIIYLRCGKPGHFAANCPTSQRPGSSSPKKRPAEDDAMVRLALHISESYDHEEFYDIEDSYDSEVFYDVEEAYI